MPSAPSRTSKSPSKALVVKRACSAAAAKKQQQQQPEQVRQMIKLQYNERKVILRKPKTLESAIRRVKQIFYLSDQQLDAQASEIVLNAVIEREDVEIGDELAWNLVRDRALLQVSLVKNPLRVAARKEAERSEQTEDEEEETEEDADTDDEQSNLEAQLRIDLTRLRITARYTYQNYTVFDIWLPHSSRVMDIAHSVYRRTGIPIDNQALDTPNTVELDLNRTFAEYGLSHGSEVTVYMIEV